MIERVDTTALALLRAFSPRSMLVSDLDGTLRMADGTMAREDLEILEALGQEDCFRVIATGRTLYSFRKVIVSPLPIDCIIFSSGAGTMGGQSGALIRWMGLEAHEVNLAARTLMAMDLDFMIQDPVPHNHRYSYYRTGRPNLDFERRCEVYRAHCRPLEGDLEGLGEATQLLAVIPPERGLSWQAEIQRALPAFSVIRTTSPLDGVSQWIEIFPSGVCKSGAASWLAGQLGLLADDVLSVGNDYNDHDLLAWAGLGCVVTGSPRDLSALYPQVGSARGGAVAEAVAIWRRAHDLSR